jgi:hypothetical protein
MVQILFGAKGSPALIMHSHTPSYRSGASNKTQSGNAFLIIVNGLLTIAAPARRQGPPRTDLPFCCPNNTASMGLGGAKSGNIHRGTVDVDELRPTLLLAGGLKCAAAGEKPSDRIAICLPIRRKNVAIAALGGTRRERFLPALRGLCGDVGGNAEGLSTGMTL